jgi:hypothetical protein
MTLSYKWASGYSDANLIGGLLPYKDGFHYYNGARFLLMGDRLPGQGFISAWRPLFPAFLAGVLFFTMENLQWSIAILVGLVGVCCFLSAHSIYETNGAFAATILSTLLYLFIQPMIGNTVSEFSGLALGCLGFVLLRKAAQFPNLKHVVFGVFILMIAISARAGAFFVFPMLILWSGWIFRDKVRFSFKTAAFVAAITVLSYVLVNTIYSKVLVGSDTPRFANFSYALYGQVMGGTGWEQAMADLGTTNSQVIYEASLEHFVEHPMDFLAGAAKSYRDFFIPNSFGIFSFISPGGLAWYDVTLWLLGLLLLARGVIQAVREFQSHGNSLIALAFLGILLSIPFLPPIDGGRRFYASTMPFFFATMVTPTLGIFTKSHRMLKEKVLDIYPHTATLSVLVVLMTLILPALVLIYRNGKEPTATRPTCGPDQVPFAFLMNSGSYIDIHPGENTSCGYAPLICFQDFKINGVEGDIDDFFQALVSLTAESNATTRIIPANDLIDGGLHFYLGSPKHLDPLLPDRIVVGCVNVIQTKHQSIYMVEAIEE